MLRLNRGGVCMLVACKFGEFPLEGGVLASLVMILLRIARGERGVIFLDFSKGGGETRSPSLMFAIGSWIFLPDLVVVGHLIVVVRVGKVVVVFGKNGELVGKLFGVLVGKLTVIVRVGKAVVVFWKLAVVVLVGKVVAVFFWKLVVPVLIGKVVVVSFCKLVEKLVALILPVVLSVTVLPLPLPLPKSILPLH